MKLGLWIAPLVLLTSCDKVKAFIDPTGESYGRKAAPAIANPSGTSTSKTPAATPVAAVQTPPPPPPSGAKFDAPIRAPEVGRNLTTAQALKEVPGIEFQDKRCTWMFRNGIGRCPSAVASLVDSAGRPWGISIGDLDLDGSDDAVVLVRMDRAGSEPSWELAYLRNEQGHLFNTHTVVLPGSEGFRDVDIQDGAVTLVPVAGGPNVMLSYSGGSLNLSSP